MRFLQADCSSSHAGTRWCWEPEKTSSYRNLIILLGSKGSGYIPTFTRNVHRSCLVACKHHLRKKNPCRKILKIFRATWNISYNLSEVSMWNMLLDTLLFKIMCINWFSTTFQTRCCLVFTSILKIYYSNFHECVNFLSFLATTLSSRYVKGTKINVSKKVEATLA